MKRLLVSLLCWVLFCCCSSMYWCVILVAVFMCLAFLAISQPVLVSCTLYDLILWFSLLCAITLPWVHSPPSLCFMPTIDCTCIGEVLFWVSLFFLLFYLGPSAMCFSFLHHNHSWLGLCLFDNSPLTGVLKSSVEGLGSSGPSVVNLMGIKAKVMLLLASVHFFIVSWQMLCGTWLVHCFDGGIMVILLALCLIFCWRFCIYLKQN